MNEDVNNPYRAPQAETVLSHQAQVDPQSYYVEGKNLVICNGAMLPNLCVKTGKPLPDAKRTKKTLYWAHPAWALLIFINLLIYAIVYLCIRKKVTFHYSISPQAKRKRFALVSSSLLLTFGSLAAGIYFLMADDPTGANTPFALAGFILFLIGLIMIAIVSNSLRIKKHRDGWFTLAGTGKEFRAAVQAEQGQTSTSLR